MRPGPPVSIINYPHVRTDKPASLIDQFESYFQDGTVKCAIVGSGGAKPWHLAQDFGSSRQVKSSTTPRITRVIFSAGYEWDVRFVFGLCDRPRRLLVHIAHSAQKTDVNAPCCVALLCGVSSSCDCPQILPLNPPAWSESPTPL